MPARKSSSAKRRLALGLLPAFALAGCADYLNHNDTVTAAAGDAQAHNMVVHVADPWPRAAYDTRIEGNGQRVDAATKRYLKGPDTSKAPAAVLSIQGASPASQDSPGSQ